MSLAPYVRKGEKSAAVGDFTFLHLQPTIGITARAGGGKANATALTTGINVISTCATSGDSVLLPDSEPGRVVLLFNAGAAPAQVFGKGTDTIDAVATGTGVPLANAKRALFICTADGAWISAQLGVVSA